MIPRDPFEAFYPTWNVSLHAPNNQLLFQAQGPRNVVLPALSDALKYYPVTDASWPPPKVTIERR